MTEDQRHRPLFLDEASRILSHHGSTIMRPSSRTLCLTLSSLCAFHALAEDLKPSTSKGCFSGADGFLSQGSFMYQSQGHCQEICVGLKKPVMALTGGSDCSCGDLLPVASSKVSDSECGTDCNGWPDQKCTFKPLLTDYPKLTSLEVVDPALGLCY